MGADLDRPSARSIAPLRLDLKKKLHALLFFRLMLAILFLVLTLVVQGRREEDLLSAHMQPLYFLSCILFAFTIVGAMGINRVKDLRWFAYCQLLFDVGAVTFVIYLSGGVESPYALLYMPVIISAALLLYRKGSLVIASACCVTYGLLLDLQYFGWISPLRIVSEPVCPKDSTVYFHSILMNIAAFYLVAYLSGYLAEEIQRYSREARSQKRELEQLQVLYQNIVQSIGSGLLTITPLGNIRFCNRAAEEILGLSLADLKDMPLRRLFPHMDSGMSDDTSEDNSPKGLPCPMERREMLYRHPSGQELYLGYTVSLLQGEEGHPSGRIVIFQNLTEQKALEEHLKRMDRMAFAGKLAAEIAHEVKNPLAAMSGAVQMLNYEMQKDPLQSRLMKILEREIERIDDLVTDFAWLARGFRKPDKVQSVSVCDAIQEVVSSLQAKGKIPAALQISVNSHSRPVLQLDSRQFKRILRNVLLNAVESLGDGGEVTVEVGVRGTGEGGEVQIDVIDTGCGIPGEDMGRIFEPFYTTKIGGAGLGLCIVYQLMENAGGRITVAPNSDRGTTFSLFFPYTPSFPLANS